MLSAAALQYISASSSLNLESMIFLRPSFASINIFSMDYYEFQDAYWSPDTASTRKSPPLKSVSRRASLPRQSATHFYPSAVTRSCIVTFDVDDMKLYIVSFQPFKYTAATILLIFAESDMLMPSRAFAALTNI